MWNSKQTMATQENRYCDYMVLSLENNTNGAKVTGMYISYDTAPREGSYKLLEGEYIPIPTPPAP